MNKYWKESFSWRNSLSFIKTGLGSCVALVTITTFLPQALASQNLQSEVWVLSMTETAFSIGALTFSMIMAYKEFAVPHMKMIALSAVVFGSTMLLLILVHTVPVFLLVMLIMGIGSPLYYTPLMTHIQENTSEAYMGRTFSYLDLCSAIAMPLGMMIFGPLATISINAAFVIPGCLLILFGIFVKRRQDSQMKMGMVE